MRARHTFPIAALVALSGCATTSTPSGGIAQGTGSSSSTQTVSGGGTSGAAAANSPLIAQSSSPGTADPPPGSAGGHAAGGGTGTPPAQTPDERRAALEHRFDDSLGSFDAALKKEQEQLAKQHDAAVASGGGNSDIADVAASTAHEGSAGPEGSRYGRGRRGSHPADHSGDLHSTKQDGVNAGGSSGNGASAREIPDGSDDDIVARRLRKAAEQETDPELKEKLWQEYAQYKKNVQAK
jgi:hypothetical protein